MPYSVEYFLGLKEFGKKDDEEEEEVEDDDEEEEEEVKPKKSKNSKKWCVNINNIYIFSIFILWKIILWTKT